MTDGDGFSFAGLISGRAPAPRPGAAVQRGKYDFAVAYPDPDSLPLDDLAASLRSALEEEGRSLAVYPHVQGYPPLREYVADKLMRTRSIDVTPGRHHPGGRLQPAAAHDHRDTDRAR